MQLEWFSIHGFVVGVIIGTLGGGWAVWQWGLRGTRPQISLHVLLIDLAVLCAVIGLSRIAGVPQGFWWSVACGVPMFLLPLLSVAMSAHSYVGQLSFLAGVFLYCAAERLLNGSAAEALAQALFAAIFLAMPGMYLAFGQIRNVEAWNLFFWQKLRNLLGVRVR